IVASVWRQQHWPIDSSRAAVNDTEQRILLCWIEIGWLDENAFDGRSILALPGNNLARSQGEGLYLIIHARQLARREAAEVAYEDFVDTGWRRNGERNSIGRAGERERTCHQIVWL